MTRPQADDAKAAAKKAEMKEKASEIRQEGDHAYGTNVSRGMPEKKMIQEEEDEDEDTDGNLEYELSSAHSESASSKFASDDQSVQSAGSESEARRKSHKAKSPKKKGNKTKDRALRQEVVSNRKTVASAGTLARKRKNENVNSEIDVDASERVPQSKRAKGTQSASNLNPDWRKTVGLLVKGSASRKSLDTDKVETSLIPETSSDLVVGEFDVDEPEEMVAAAREHKSTKVKDTKTSGSVSAIYRTTAGMGLKINRKGADDAVKEEVRAVKMLKPQKPLQKLKLKDLPLQDKSDCDVWNRLVCAVIDWAGSTTTDPFGTNEHPDLSPKLQELWNIFFHHNALDINEHPAIKKLATNRLNEWRSTFGKDALKILKCQFKCPEFCHDVDAHIKFVHDYLPRKVNNQKRVPFVFADIEVGSIPMLGSYPPLFRCIRHPSDVHPTPIHSIRYPSAFRMTCGYLRISPYSSRIRRIRPVHVHSTSLYRAILYEDVSDWLPRSNVHVSKWNEELLYVGGFLARMVYDSEMSKVCDVWSKLGKTDAEVLGLYTMKSFMFHPTTPDPKVSHMIKNVFFVCSKTDEFLFISDQGIWPTKNICHSHKDFDLFMRTPVVPVDLRPLLKSTEFPGHLRVGPYTLTDIVKELKSRSLPDVKMVAFLCWWSTSFGSLDISHEQRTMWCNKFLRVGRTHWQGKEIKFSSISKFIDEPMLAVRCQDDPLPEDTIPPALIQGLDLSKISDTFGWKKMTIAHWLRHLMDGTPDPAHDITKAPTFAQHVLSVLSNLWDTLQDKESHSEVREILKDVACIPMTISNVPSMKRPRDTYFPYADIFHDLPIVKQELLVESRTVRVLQYSGVQKRCDIDSLITQLNSDDRWNVMDLARYIRTSPQEDVTHVMDMKFFPCSNGERHHIKEIFASTEINRALRLPVVKCDSWNSNSEEALFLTRQGLREYPTIEKLITITSSESNCSARQAAWSSLCGPSYETELEEHFDPSRFPSHAFIPGVRDGQPCQFFHHEVFSDANWAIFGFGHLDDKRIIAKLQIQEGPTAETLLQVLESKPPGNPERAKKWFKFLAEKVFSTETFEKIADLKIVPIEVSYEKPQSNGVSYEHVPPRECCLESTSYPSGHLYRRLFKFVDFGLSANAFLEYCRVKKDPGCIDIVEGLLKCPQKFREMAGDEESYLAELRLIAKGHKSLPSNIEGELRDAQIFLGY
ncbi:uncharacterized protein EDB91DRAFT_1252521 [Suillus paluster]|uniref:uncharacterized protein n=1 Tax=Suillus paluster TaxID=48578 RepID=UPI001B884482|nr:uncharacterized protein EDB91DRAFT_1252521 [Suillus paluster]KAG1730656.1 hypothetical protein EDB91DRAFT_1252521 [Suillus paluster]